MDPVPAAVRATYAAFVSAGIAGASWASRIPQVRDRLHLDPAGLGIVLLSMAVGSLLALPAAGLIVHRFTTRHTVAGMSVLLGLGLGVVAAGYQLTSTPVVMLGLFVCGFAVGTWDVAMNVQAADVERALGRSIMPRFHAGFSIGTVAGAGLGTLLVAWATPVAAHLGVVAVLVAAVVPFTIAGFLPDHPAEPVPDGERARHQALRRWREPRTLLVGLILLSFALAEGTGVDWVAIALIDGRGVAPAIGTLGLAVFLAAMTTSRWFGPALLDRFGRVVTLRALGTIAVGGLMLFVLGPNLWLALLGAAAWGCGISLGFPVGMSAAADEPAAAAARVSVVSAIGYWAFLAGPPLIGTVGQHLTVPHALLLVVGVLAVAVAVSGAARPLTPSE